MSTAPIAQGPVDVNVRPWFRNVKPGDMLHPVPLWNQTERGPNCLPVPVEVLDVIDANSQSGVLFAVRTKGGYVRNLDAAWFKRPNVRSQATDAASSRQVACTDGLGVEPSGKD